MDRRTHFLPLFPVHLKTCVHIHTQARSGAYADESFTSNGSSRRPVLTTCRLPPCMDNHSEGREQSRLPPIGGYVRDMQDKREDTSEMQSARNCEPARKGGHKLNYGGFHKCVGPTALYKRALSSFLRQPPTRYLAARSLTAPRPNHLTNQSRRLVGKERGAGNGAFLSELSGRGMVGNKFPFSLSLT